MRDRPVPLYQPRRVAVLSLHTSPLEQPGTGDAGGMNVYISQTARRLAARGTSVEVFTRATSSEQPPVQELAPGVLVRHVQAGPFEGLGRAELPGLLCAFAAGVQRAEARHEPGYYDLVHSHYWLSGQVGWLASERWGVPLVHTAHTLARVKNAALAEGDTPEPRLRELGEQQIVDEAARLTANTPVEAEQLIELYGAGTEQVDVVRPGVDLERYTPGSRAESRAELGLPADAVVLGFVGRIQPLKAPDVLLRAAAELLAGGGVDRAKLRVLVVGGPSGSGLAQPTNLQELAAKLGIQDVVSFLPPQSSEQLAHVYRAADVIAVPSHNESFGLVALEAQACATPVVAADVGGLPVAVADGTSGLLVSGHEPARWASALRRVIEHRPRFVANAAGHAARFSWERTTDALLEAYTRAARRFGRGSARAGIAV
ncbi:D-inositol-3-phosphate glycosyltransferase [Tamaricihabitans halophyticus]|uniref:D-inositol-3-phosphate glycosyltransferase n=1 Tax=Tamaricihabitans halophyticus TaxID=1262583 RepID=UPI001FB4C7DE|nr:D-inositol-3-phosphate glycosyltransferase [Tamaricihabitans halophyticus]